MMSENPNGMRDGLAASADQLLARAAAAETRAHDGLAVATHDFFLPEAGRLDERTRAGLASLIAVMIETVEGEIREHALGLLHARNESKLVVALSEPGSVQARLWDSGVLADPALMAELIARVRQELLGDALPMQAPDEAERPSLINRFVEHPDRVVAAGAMALLIAESRRRGSPETGHFQTELPAELHHQLVWWVAAALREGVGGGCEALDRALTESVQRSLGAHDEGDRLEAAAMRLAAAIDPQAGEWTSLLVEALGDRRIVLFVALLAHGLTTPYAVARDLVLDPDSERLWLALRSLGVTREGVAQIGYALCEADSRRDLEKLPDAIDAIDEIDPARARSALAPIRLHPDFRAAVIALSRKGAA
jgi:hypothetical protein